MPTPDPFVYIPPNEVTAPKYAAIRAAEAETRAAIQQQIGGGTWQGDHAGHYDAQAAYTAINDACRSFYAAILEHAPPSADRAAAERCVRLARMAANEAVTTTPTAELLELRRQCVDNLRAARWQACAAMTHVWRLSDWDQFAPESRHWWRPTWGDDRKGGDESTVAVAFCGPAVDILTVECPPSRLQIPIRYDLSALAYPRPPEDWRVGDPPSGEVARTPLPRAGLDDLDALRPAADAFLSSICGGAARFTKPSERSG